MEIGWVRENLSVRVSTFPLTIERKTERPEEILRNSGAPMTMIKGRIPDTAPAQSDRFIADDVRCVRFSNVCGICPIPMNDSGTFNQRSS